MRITCINNKVPISPEMLSYFLTLIDENKRTKIEKYKHYQDFANSLIADVLVRFLIFENAKIKYIKKPFLFTDYGKPYLPIDINLQFNISHSGEWIACAIDEQAIGIDLELMQEIDPFEIARDFFTAEEYDMILKGSHMRNELFYDIWTLKESYIKALGKGLSIKLDSFSIIKANNTINYTTQLQHKPCHFKQYNIDDRYKLSVCSFNNHFPADVTYLDIHSLYESLICSIS